MTKSANSLLAGWLGAKPASRTSEQMAAYLKGEIDKYGKIVRAIGLKID